MLLTSKCNSVTQFNVSFNNVPSKELGAPSSLRYKKRKDSMKPQKLPSAKRKKMKRRTGGKRTLRRRSRIILSAGKCTPRGIKRIVMAEIPSKMSYV
jgi:hypothetical protein